MQRRFMQVDVFDSGPFTGNPLAVVLDGAGLTTEQMQQITDWTNLSEATFLLPPTEPGADYLVRIFCPGRELPFAGHPTLGSCQAWLEAGNEPRSSDCIIQQCGAGLIEIRRHGELLAFAAPPITRSGPIEPELLDERLGQLGLTATDVVDAAWIDNGPGWMGLLLHDAAAVLDVAMPVEPIPGFDVGLIGMWPAGEAVGTPSGSPDGEAVAIEVRGLFADASGSVREDPVTGSLNASAAQWLIATERIAAPYVAAQGQMVGRAGRIHVSEADGELWIGGHSTVAVSGTIDA